MPLLNTVVAPLDPISMEGTLNWVSEAFEKDEMTAIKALNFQREAFLHPRYPIYLETIKAALKAAEIYVTFLSESQLIELYKLQEYGSFLELS
jgi:hypothetical protein